MVRHRIEEPISPDTCYWCRVPLDSDGTCPECGRRQVRVCFCGEEMAPGVDVCPACGADWRGVVKVRRRKRRRSADVLSMARYAAAGVLVALLLAALGNSIVNGLALRSATGTSLPEAPGDRLGLAWQTLARTSNAVASAFIERIGGAALFVAMGIVGGLVGILLYLRNRGERHRHPDFLEPEYPRRRHP
jgi:hypothetical protein